MARQTIISYSCLAIYRFARPLSRPPIKPGNLINSYFTANAYLSSATSLVSAACRNIKRCMLLSFWLHAAMVVSLVTTHNLLKTQYSRVYDYTIFCSGNSIALPWSLKALLNLPSFIPELDSHQGLFDIKLKSLRFHVNIKPHFVWWNHWVRSYFLNQLQLSMERHERVSINASPHSETWFLF